MEPGTRVRLPNGLVGTIAWTYENPVHRPGYHDRAMIDIVREDGRWEGWGASLDRLEVVE